jgi:hypothetical protein
MPGPGITRPDLCSKRAAARQAEFADTARGPLSADGCPLAVITRSHRCRIMPLALCRGECPAHVRVPGSVRRRAS